MIPTIGVHVSIRVICVESALVKSIDTVSPLSRLSTKCLPEIRVYGHTPRGQTCLVHINEIYPAFYIPAPSFKQSEGENMTNPPQTVVWNISVERRTPIYGYYAQPMDFFKIELVDPFILAKIAALLENGLFRNHRFTPFEVHIPYILGSMLAYGFRGMEFLTLKDSVRFRSPLPASVRVETLCSHSAWRSQLKEWNEELNKQGEPTEGPWRAFTCRMQNNRGMCSDSVCNCGKGTPIRMSKQSRIGVGIELEIDAKASDIIHYNDCNGYNNKNTGSSSISGEDHFGINFVKPCLIYFQKEADRCRNFNISISQLVSTSFSATKSPENRVPLLLDEDIEQQTKRLLETNNLNCKPILQQIQSIVPPLNSEFLMERFRNVRNALQVWREGVILNEGKHKWKMMQIQLPQIFGKDALQMAFGNEAEQTDEKSKTSLSHYNPDLDANNDDNEVQNRNIDESMGGEVDKEDILLFPSRITPSSTLQSFGSELDLSSNTEEEESDDYFSKRIKRKINFVSGLQDLSQISNNLDEVKFMKTSSQLSEIKNSAVSQGQEYKPLGILLRPFQSQKQSQTSTLHIRSQQRKTKLRLDNLVSSPSRSLSSPPREDDSNQNNNQLSNRRRRSSVADACAVSPMASRLNLSLEHVFSYPPNALCSNIAPAHSVYTPSDESISPGPPTKKERHSLVSLPTTQFAPSPPLPVVALFSSPPWKFRVPTRISFSSLSDVPPGKSLHNIKNDRWNHALLSYFPNQIASQGSEREEAPVGSSPPPTVLLSSPSSSPSTPPCEPPISCTPTAIPSTASLPLASTSRSLCVSTPTRRLPRQTSLPDFFHSPLHPKSSPPCEPQSSDFLTTCKRRNLKHYPLLPRLSFGSQALPLTKTHSDHSQSDDRRLPLFPLSRIIDLDDEDASKSSSPSSTTHIESVSLLTPVDLSTKMKQPRRKPIISTELMIGATSRKTHDHASEECFPDNAPRRRERIDIRGFFLPQWKNHKKITIALSPTQSQLPPNASPAPETPECSQQVSSCMIFSPSGEDEEATDIIERQATLDEKDEQQRMACIKVQPHTFTLPSMRLPFYPPTSKSKLHDLLSKAAVSFSKTLSLRLPLKQALPSLPLFNLPAESKFDQVDYFLQQLTDSIRSNRVDPSPNPPSISHSSSSTCSQLANISQAKTVGEILALLPALRKKEESCASKVNSWQVFYKRPPSYACVSRHFDDAVSSTRTVVTASMNSVGMLVQCAKKHQVVINNNNKNNDYNDKNYLSDTTSPTKAQNDKNTLNNHLQTSRTLSLHLQPSPITQRAALMNGGGLGLSPAAVRAFDFLFAPLLGSSSAANLSQSVNGSPFPHSSNTCETSTYHSEVFPLFGNLMTFEVLLDTPPERYDQPDPKHDSLLAIACGLRDERVASRLSSMYASQRHRSPLPKKKEKKKEKTKKPFEELSAKDISEADKHVSYISGEDDMENAGSDTIKLHDTDAFIVLALSTNSTASNKNISACLPTCVDYYEYDSESSLLRGFIDLTLQFDPSLILSWNINQSFFLLEKKAAAINFPLFFPQSLSRLATVPPTSANPYGARMRTRASNTAVPSWTQMKQPHSNYNHPWDSPQHACNGRLLLSTSRLVCKELKCKDVSLGALARQILGKTVPSFSMGSLAAWWKNPSMTHTSILKLVDNIRISILVLDKAGTLERFAELSSFFGMPFSSSLVRGSQFRVESMLFTLTRQEKMLLNSPSKKQTRSQDGGEALPLVMEPKSAIIMDPVVVLDFMSLYPSVVIAFNLCFSTCIGKLIRFEKGDRNRVIKLGCQNVDVPPALLAELICDAEEGFFDEILTSETEITPPLFVGGSEVPGGTKRLWLSPNGVLFVKKSVRQGILPRMLADLLSTRQMVKKAQKLYTAHGVPDIARLHTNLDHKQFALKLTANCTFGYTSASFSGRMPCIEVGDSIVQTSRRTLERTIALIRNCERWRASVEYGDTDSVFVKLPGRSLRDAFTIGREIANEATRLCPTPMELQFEKVYLPAVLMTKKRYFGIAHTTPPPELLPGETEEEVERTAIKNGMFDSKGVEVIRSDQCDFTSVVMERALRDLFISRDISKMRIYIDKQFARLICGNVSLKSLLFFRRSRLGRYTAERSEDKLHTLPGQAIVAYQRIRNRIQKLKTARLKRKQLTSINEDPTVDQEEEIEENLTNLLKEGHEEGLTFDSSCVPFVYTTAAPGDRLSDIVAHPGEVSGCWQVTDFADSQWVRIGDGRMEQIEESSIIFHAAPAGAVDGLLYARRQVIPPLQRVLNLLETPVNLLAWLNEMQSSVSSDMTLRRRKKSEQKGSRILRGKINENSNLMKDFLQKHESFHSCLACNSQFSPPSKTEDTISSPTRPIQSTSQLATTTTTEKHNILHPASPITCSLPPSAPGSPVILPSDPPHLNLQKILNLPQEFPVSALPVKELSVFLHLSKNSPPPWELLARLRSEIEDVLALTKPGNRIVACFLGMLLGFVRPIGKFDGLGAIGLFDSNNASALATLDDLTKKLDKKLKDGNNPETIKFKATVRAFSSKIAALIPNKPGVHISEADPANLISNNLLHRVEKYLCSSCSANPRGAVSLALRNLNLSERQQRSCRRTCITCTGSREGADSCLDAFHCDTYFERAKIAIEVRKNTWKTNKLMNLINDW